MKKFFSRLGLLAVILLIPVFPLSAASSISDSNSVHVSREEIVDGNLYAVSDNVNIEGTISGDLIVMSKNLVVNGQVEGDIIALSQDISISGEVGGNIRVAGESVAISSKVARNLNVIGQNIILTNDANIGWDAYILGESVESRATIEGGLKGRINKLQLFGRVGKNVQIDSDYQDGAPIIVANGAIINGNLEYRSENEASINNGANIAGEKIHQKKDQAPQAIPSWLTEKLLFFIAALIVGSIMIFPGKKLSLKLADSLNDNPWKKLLIGLAAALLIMPVFVVLAIFVVSLPLAFIGAGAFLIFFYLGKIISALFIGRWLISKLLKKPEESLFWPLFAGLLLSYIVFSLPILGPVFYLFVTLTGLGAIINHLYVQSRNL
jgi:cytoskeletal protein CcmA (bactofilin family)